MTGKARSTKQPGRSDGPQPVKAWLASTVGPGHQSVVSSPISRVFTLIGDPIGKPRMTRRDKWKQRTCVMAYRAWADQLRAAAGVFHKLRLSGAVGISVRAYFKIPENWSQQKKTELAGKPHIVKPDMDNVLKAVADALFENKVVWRLYCVACRAEARVA